jgi:hypothetical protein
VDIILIVFALHLSIHPSGCCVALRCVSFIVYFAKQLPYHIIFVTDQVPEQVQSRRCCPPAAWHGDPHVRQFCFCVIIVIYITCYQKTNANANRSWLFWLFICKTFDALTDFVGVFVVCAGVRVIFMLAASVRCK